MKLAIIQYTATAGVLRTIQMAKLITFIVQRNWGSYFNKKNNNNQLYLNRFN